MSVLAAGTLCREHLRQVERLAWGVLVLKSVAERRAEHLYASYAARIRHEREVWTTGLTQLADELDALLDVEGAVAYALANWTPVIPLPTGKALWASVRKQEPSEGWRSPNADEVATRLAASQPHTDAWILGALQVYLGMAVQTSQEAGTMSLRLLGKGVAWEWADPRVMARDLYQVRGSKIVQQMYGAHVDQLRNIILSATDPRSPRTLAQVRSLIRESWPALRAYQIDRIARTETATIWTHTSMQAYAANGVEHWESTIAHGPTIGVESENPCPECVAEALYLHDMSDDWPPWHPNCRCEAVPIFEDPDTGEVWLPPDEPWAGGAGAGEDLAIVEGTEAALARVPRGDGPILSPVPLPSERMSLRPSTQTAAEPYRLPRRGTGRLQAYTPEGDVRAMITSCNNRISGLKTRLKKTIDPTKRAELEARLEEQYRLRAELKAKLGELPPPPPPAIVPPPIPDKPWVLDDTQAVFEDVIADYRGHKIRITWKSKGTTMEGTVSREGEYWLLDGVTMGNGRGVTMIEVRFGDRWVKVAEQAPPPALKLPEKVITLDRSEERLNQVLRNLEGHDVKVWYRSGDGFQGKLMWDDGHHTFILQGERASDVRAISMPEHVLRVEARVVGDDNVVRYVTVARQELKSVEELRAELTSAGNKLSGLKTRLKRELGRSEGPRYAETLAIQERIRVLEAERERLRLAIEEARGRPYLPPEQPLGPVEPPTVAPLAPGGSFYLEKGPGSSPLADELAKVRARLAREIAGGLEEDLDRAVRTVIQAGERVERELRAQGMRHITDAMSRAHAERDAIILREEEVRMRWRTAYQEFEYTMNQYRNRLATDAYGRPYRDLTWGERHQIDRGVLEANRDARVAEEAMERARAAQDEIARELSANERAISDIASDAVAAERQALVNVLEQVRDMGPASGAELRYVMRTGTETKVYNAKGTRLVARQFAKTKKVLDDAQRLFPRAWLRVQRPADIGWISRGHHGNRGDWQELRISKTDRSKVASDRDGFSTGVHEMGHEVEDTVEWARILERRFYEQRTRGEELQSLRKLAPRNSYDSHEVARPDEFSDPYTGKYYDGRSYEIISMGLEAVWTHSYRLDPEYRQFILGLLGLI